MSSDAAPVDRRPDLDLLGALLDGVPARISYVDPEHRFRYLNRAYEAQFRRPREDMIGQHLRDVLGVETYGAVRSYVDAALAGAEVTYERLTTFPTGESRITRITHAPDRAPDGAVRGVIACVTDVTEQRRAEIALREREEEARRTSENLRALIDACPLAVMLLNLNGTVAMWNPAAERMFGWRADDVVGRPLPTVDDEHRSELLAHLDRVAQGIPIVGVETRRRARDRVLDVRLWSVPVHGARGELRCLSIVEDVTAARRAADRSSRLRAIAASLTGLLDPTDVATAIVDQAVAATGARAGAVVRSVEESATFDVLYAAGYQTTVPEAERVTARWRQFSAAIPTPVGDALRTGTPICLEGAEDRRARYPHLAELDHLIGDGPAITVPLVIENHALGALHLAFSAADQIGEDDHAFLNAVARLCAQALERARLYAAERSARERAERLLAVTTALAATRTLAEVGQTIAAAGVSALDGSGAVVALVSADGETLEPLAATGDPGARLIAPMATATDHPMAAAVCANQLRLAAIRPDGTTHPPRATGDPASALETGCATADPAPALDASRAAGDPAPTTELFRAAADPDAPVEAMQSMRHLDAPIEAMHIVHDLDAPVEAMQVVHDLDAPVEAMQVVHDLDAPVGSALVAVPLATQGRVLGVLAVRFGAGRRLSRDDAALLRAVAHQGAVVVERARLHAAEQRSRVLLDEVIDTSPFGIAVYDAAEPLVCRRHNEPYLALFGEDVRRAGTIVGRPLHDLFDAESYRSIHGLIERVRATREPIRIDEFPAVLLPDPNPRFYQWSLTPIVLGDAIAWLVIEAVEVTALVRARSDAEAARAQLAAVVEQMPSGLVIAEAPSGRSLMTNALADEILQPSPGPADTVSFAGFHIDGRPYQPDEWPIARAIRTGEVIGGEEIRIRRRDGTLGTIRVSSAPIHDADGAIVMGVAIFQDITPAWRAAEAQTFLAEAGAVLASSLDRDEILRRIAGLAVPHLADTCLSYLVEDDGTIHRVGIADVDPGRVERLRAATNETLPADGAEGVAWAVRTRRSDFLADLPAASGDPAANPVWRAGLPLEQTRSLMIVPMVVHERAVGALVLATNSSDRRYDREDLALADELARRAALAVENARLYREAQEAIRARDRFLSIAAHELRTPVTAAKGYAQMLGRTRARGQLTDERLDRFVSSIATAADRLAGLTEDLLDVTRIRTGQLQLETRPIDLTELVRRIVERHQDHLDPRHRLTLDRPPGPCIELADPDRLEQVVENLLSNAIKYSPDGGEIRVDVDVDRASWTLRVRDAGIGVPPEALETIFQPFGRGANAAARNLPGMGLGLYICRSIIERHGGTMWAESAGDGTGTTVIVRLPRGSAPEAERA